MGTSERAATPIYEFFGSGFPVAIDPAVARGAGDSMLMAQIRY